MTKTKETKDTITVLMEDGSYEDRKIHYTSYRGKNEEVHYPCTDKNEYIYENADGIVVCRHGLYAR